MVKKESPIDEKRSLKRSDGTYELPDLPKDVPCPACGEKGVHLTRTIYKLPDGDDILILVLQCDYCGYRKADTIPLHTAFKAGKYILTVDDGDLTHKIFRGITGDLEIPEIGVEIERGPAATFHFTNVEGILLQIKKQVELFLSTTPSDTPEWKNAKNTYDKLLKCLKGELPFTIILKDKEGGSYISPTNEEKLRFEEY